MNEPISGPEVLRMMTGDSTDVLGRLLALEVENRRLWGAMNEMLHDHDTQAKAIAELAIRVNELAGRLKPPAGGSSE